MYIISCTILFYECITTRNIILGINRLSNIIKSRNIFLEGNHQHTHTHTLSRSYKHFFLNIKSKTSGEITILTTGSVANGYHSNRVFMVHVYCATKTNSWTTIIVRELLMKLFIMKFVSKRYDNNYILMYKRNCRLHILQLFM